MHHVPPGVWLLSLNSSKRSVSGIYRAGEWRMVGKDVGREAMEKLTFQRVK